MNNNITLAIWVAVIAVAFVFLWRKGYLLRFSNYVMETREELRKCTWPSLDELKGSTVVVIVSILLLGVFTIGVDFVLTLVVRLMTQS